MMLWFYVLTNVFFAVVAIYFSYRYEKKTEQVERQKKEIARRMFELSLLQSIADRIGYSLNLESISETIALTAENIFELSTVSYGVVKHRNISIKTFKKEPVDGLYIEKLTKIIKDAMNESDPATRDLPIEMIEAESKPVAASDQFASAVPQTYFNIPMMVSGKLVGMINISSRNHIKYDDGDIDFLNKIVTSAQNAIQRLHDVIKTEEAKTEKIRADFTDMMMHELRAPLTAIRGAASLMLSPALAQEEKDKMPRIILDSSNDMLSTVSDFLDAAKLDEGKFKLNKMLCDIVKVINEHVEVFSYAAREKKITLEFDKNVTVPQFLFDQIRVGQVINNLISNSLKFTNEGGFVKLKVEVKDKEVEVTCTDNGIGIPESKKAILFTKFGQVEGNFEKVQPVNRSAGSSGLGLFISKQIVDSHGGKIWLDSKENGGTVAHFTLPILTEDLTKPATPTPPVQQAPASQAAVQAQAPSSSTAAPQPADPAKLPN
ncbi:MAG TPA: GAF domain-containing sensor histidine kinase [Patescibacteria group bacterium]|nr:GAF domain-containing sensor histidine kinase [Patescibacteria group bacterium]